MGQNVDTMTCSKKCSIIAGAAAFVLWLLMMLVFGWGWFISLLIAVVIGAVLWFMLPRYVCPDAAQGQGRDAGSHPMGGAARSDPGPAAKATTPSALAEKAGEADASVPTGGSAPASAFEAPKPADKPASPATTPSALAEDVTEGDATVSTGASAPASAFEAPRPAETPATKPRDTKAAASPSDAPAKGATDIPGKDTDAKAQTAPSKAGAASKSGAADAKSAASGAQGDAPELLSAPRDGTPDNLKLISGVGPKLEETLNEIGIWHFDQIAKWGEKDIAWVDSHLRFKGRIERDDWMAQAKVLAEGGETAFSKRKKK